MKRLTLFLLTITFFSCQPSKQPDVSVLYPSDTVSIKYHSEWTATHYKERIDEFMLNPLQQGDIVFLGNSITEGGGDWGDKFDIPNVKNRGISGDVTDGVLMRLGEIVYYKPYKVFMMIGVNDLFNLHYQKQIPSTEYVANNILKIVKKIHELSPRTKIYVESILPDHRDFMSPLINEVNNVLKSHDGEGFVYLDINPLFRNDKGLMNEKLSYDGTHLNADGYKLWRNTIKEIVQN